MIATAISPSEESDATRLKVFISYSRADAGFANELVAGLAYDGGFAIDIDEASIHEGEEWRPRLGALVAANDIVVFVLTPNSAASPICRWEIEEAERLSKRILPVLAEPLEGVEPPPQLAKLNYVRFDEGRSFMTALTELRSALKTDIVWLREHTRLLTRAIEWDQADRADNRLLSGTDIDAAKQWLAARPADAPDITDWHRDFISASDRAEAARQSKERKRAETLQLAVTRTRWALLGAMLFAGAALITGLWGLAERQRGFAEAARAKTNSEIAEREKQRADRFVNLVDRDPSGLAAMQKICREAINVTVQLAGRQTIAPTDLVRARFNQLYFGPMYIVELHQRYHFQREHQREGSAIEAAMIKFKQLMDAGKYGIELRRAAKTVDQRCTCYLKLERATPCNDKYGMRPVDN